MLIFNLKKEWFEKIKSGEKTHEYREVNPYWTKRIGCDLFKDRVIKFCLGYPKRDDKNRNLYAYVIRVDKLESGINTDLAIDKPVFDIKFELIEEK